MSTADPVVTTADERCGKCLALLYADGRCPQGHGYFTERRLPSFVIHGWRRDLEAEPLGSWECEKLRDDEAGHDR